VKECPTCKALLVFPRNDSQYCEDCGWPDGDFDGVYEYPLIGEQLGDYQPDLEYFNGSEWQASGIIHGRYTKAFRGLYRRKRKVQEAPNDND